MSGNIFPEVFQDDLGVSRHLGTSGAILYSPREGPNIHAIVSGRVVLGQNIGSCGLKKPQSNFSLVVGVVDECLRYLSLESKQNDEKPSYDTSLFRRLPIQETYQARISVGLLYAGVKLSPSGNVPLRRIDPTAAISRASSIRRTNPSPRVSENSSTI